MARKDQSSSGKAALRRRRGRSTGLPWRLPPLAWTLLEGRGGDTDGLGRIMVVGACPEALALAKSLPGAEIIVVESVVPALRALRLSASRRRLSNVVCIESSPGADDLLEATGRNFDLVFALQLPDKPHELSSSLRNVCQAVSRPAGVVHLRVPGPGHPFHHPSETLEALGLPLDLQGTGAAEFPPLLSLAAHIAGDTFGGGLAGASFPGAVLSLDEWCGALEPYGLHFRSALHVPRAMAAGLAHGGLEALRHLGGRPLASLLDTVVRPTARHLLFSPEPPPPPPFDDPAALGRWRPAVRYWPRSRIAPLEAPFTRPMNVEIDIPGVMPPLRMGMSSYMLEILRNASGVEDLATIASAIPHEADLADLASGFHFFHHACVCALQPPDAPLPSAAADAPLD
jgi:hypothetical protein